MDFLQAGMKKGRTMIIWHSSLLRLTWDYLVQRNWVDIFNSSLLNYNRIQSEFICIPYAPLIFLVFGFIWMQNWNWGLLLIKSHNKRVYLHSFPTDLPSWIHNISSITDFALGSTISFILLLKPVPQLAPLPKPETEYSESCR